MSALRVLQPIPPWYEVARQVEEDGKKFAWKNNVESEWKEGSIGIRNLIAEGWQVAIIDESQPELTAEWWDGFDWEFFNQWGGISAENEYRQALLSWPPTELSSSMELRESPPYPWSGGKQPVPDNVEVTLERRAYGYTETTNAGNVPWCHAMGGSDNDIISFRITGRVL